MSSDEITYRQAMVLDLPIFVALDKELFPYSPWSSAQYQEEFASSTRYFVVAIDKEQRILGYAGVFAPGVGATADILTVGVVPAHRGKGIARQLMALLTDWASKNGASAMMLEVKHDNVEAIGLYQSLGYETLNTRKDYFGYGLAALVMRKQLP
jgi:ribosomal-protein-alanine N-acetyltransferase